MLHRVTIDSATAAKLHEVDDVIAICNESGLVLGYFSSSSRTNDAPLLPNYSKEELDRWFNEPGGRSLKEIMVDLEKLP